MGLWACDAEREAIASPLLVRLHIQSKADLCHNTDRHLDMSLKTNPLCLYRNLKQKLCFRLAVDYGKIFENSRHQTFATEKLLGLNVEKYPKSYIV